MVVLLQKSVIELEFTEKYNHSKKEHLLRVEFFMIFEGLKSLALTVEFQIDNLTFFWIGSYYKIARELSQIGVT